MSCSDLLHVKLVNDFQLPRSYSSLLKEYYLLHWQTLYVFKKLTERPDGLIEHNGTLFVPILKSETFALDKESQLMLSFRVPDWQTHRHTPNYVLIKAM